MEEGNDAEKRQRKNFSLETLVNDLVKGYNELENELKGDRQAKKELRELVINMQRNKVTQRDLEKKVDEFKQKLERVRLEEFKNQVAAITKVRETITGI